MGESIHPDSLYALIHSNKHFRINTIIELIQQCTSSLPEPRGCIARRSGETLYFAFAAA